MSNVSVRSIDLSKGFDDGTCMQRAGVPVRSSAILFTVCGCLLLQEENRFPCRPMNEALSHVPIHHRRNTMDLARGAGQVHGDRYEACYCDWHEGCEDYGQVLAKEEAKVRRHGIFPFR
jgi:hypothetical protein